MIYYVTVGGRTFEVEPSGGHVVVDGESLRVELVGVDGGRVHSLIVDGHSRRVGAHGRGGGLWDLDLRGWRIEAAVVDERTRQIREMTGRSAAPAGPRPIVAPMPGLIVRVEVAVGDTVATGQGIVIVEAMKMENELTASGPGVVRAVHVQKGEAVEKDQLLVELAPLNEVTE